jgi:hypothetical protein
VAWENVQARKEDGGLGVKDLELQNRCLLMKFIDKLFFDESVAWKDWLLRDAASFDTPSTGSHGYLWKSSLTSSILTIPLMLLMSLMARLHLSGLTIGSLPALFAFPTPPSSPMLLGQMSRCNVFFSKWV